MRMVAKQFRHWLVGRHGLYMRVALVIVSALLCATSFPPVRIGWLMWLALVPFFIALHGTDVRTSFWLSFLFGMLYFGIPLHWFKNIFGIACIGVYVLGAVGPMLFGIARSLVERAWGATIACILTPVLWVGAEFFQSELWYFRFSWLKVGLS
ncbi:MAG TPA: hypothetical protein EYP10_14880, partial [Armatimonadetes bacterium]|nr:hypothetical protein [Armatimonadota bacterium]